MLHSSVAAPQGLFPATRPRFQAVNRFTTNTRVERAITNEEKWVYWAPYWYSDGKHIIYTAADHSNELARPNYDLYWMNIETGKTLRITHAPGQDVLPVFSPDYKKLMWTSSRDGRSPTQLYIADFTPPKP